MAAPKGNNNHLKHGKRHTSIYDIWRSMRQRCYNHNTINYKYYGAKGITVCDEWRESFEAFYEWAVVNGYQEGLTIDRIDTNGNYEPNNCRWATQKTQQNNRQNNHLETYRGETHTIAEWSEITGIKVPTIWARLQKGWSIEETLTIKPRKGANKH